MGGKTVAHLNGLIEINDFHSGYIHRGTIAGKLKGVMPATIPIA